MLFDETLYAEKSETVHVRYDCGVGKGGQENWQCRGKQQGPPKNHIISIRVPIRGHGAGVEELSVKLTKSWINDQSGL